LVVYWFAAVLYALVNTAHLRHAERWFAGSGAACHLDTAAAFLVCLPRFRSAFHAYLVLDVTPTWTVLLFRFGLFSPHYRLVAVHYPAGATGRLPTSSVWLYLGRL